MKNINKIIASALMGVALVSCNDLDTIYEGGIVTPDQKAEVLEIKPEMAVAGVTGITANFSRFCAMFGSGDGRQDWDYGYPGLMLGLDHKTADMNARYVGYNWFLSFAGWSSITPQGDETYAFWRNEYNQIFVANNVLESIPADTESEELLIFRAQAQGFRAFNYWVLAQLYQFNYQGNEDKPCVPIITELNRDAAAKEGALRASVQEVYDQILGDLNSAIEITENSNIQISSYVASKPRRMLYLDALYGLRARVYLTMGKYAEAAADAQKAIAVSPCYPLSIEECSKPGFAGFEHNWMWGIAIAETDRVVTSGIINNPSMLCSFAYGYVTVGAFRGMATDLYDAIPPTDVRKGWWLDEDYDSPILSDEQRAYLHDYGFGSVSDQESSLIEHTNVKFDSYNSILNQSVNANDIPMMRIEEMYYIAAEALAMSGNISEASQILYDFETTYRNPNFLIAASDPESFQDLVWEKRRIELWGEGLAYFDLQRLGKPVDRRNSGAYSTWRFNIPATDPVRIYMIPEGEMQANAALKLSAAPNTPEGNNVQGTRPTPAR